MHKKIIILSLAVILSFILISAQSCGSRIMCFVLDNDCPGAHLDLVITKCQITDVGYGPLEAIPVAQTILSGSVTTEISRVVEGYEINFGFWSKDSYRWYTVDDYLREVKGITNPTQSDRDAVSDDELKAWFKKKHTVKRSWPLSNDPPRDVKIVTKTIKKGPCVTIEDGYHYELKGTIIVGGAMCKIKPVSAGNLYDQSSPVRLKVQAPCPDCY
jgi:hypothetical protein